VCLEHDGACLLGELTYMKFRCHTFSISVPSPSISHCPPTFQVACCLCEASGASVAVKVIRNQPAYYHQARVEVGILQMLNNRCDAGGEDTGGRGWLVNAHMEGEDREVDRINWSHHHIPPLRLL
jgi:hypothetical protein